MKMTTVLNPLHPCARCYHVNGADDNDRPILSNCPGECPVSDDRIKAGNALVPLWSPLL